MSRRITITIADDVTDEEAINAIWLHIGAGKISHKNGRNFYAWATVYKLPKGEETVTYTSDRSKSPNASFYVTKTKKQ